MIITAGFWNASKLNVGAMNEFLNVAKNLEVKKISKDVEFDKENQTFAEPDISDNENAANNDSEENPHTEVCL